MTRLHVSAWRRRRRELLTSDLPETPGPDPALDGEPVQGGGQVAVLGAEQHLLIGRGDQRVGRGGTVHDQLTAFGVPGPSSAPAAAPVG
jgi:hypothetical protein